MAEPVPGSGAAWIAETWSAQLAVAIEAMTGDLPQSTSQPLAGDLPAGVLWWQHSLSVAPPQPVWIGAAEPSWLTIGKHLLSSAGIEASEPADARNTYLEIASQAVSGLCQAISKTLGTNVSSDGGLETGPAPGASLFEIRLKLASESLPLYVGVSPGIKEVLADRGASAPVRSPEPQSGQPAPPDATPRKNDPSPLELVLEVELPVSVSFGRAELPLRDVLKLTTGSIVELNRGLNDPVEVIVNNCVIARGEVVVIDGNYGVRIQEIVSRDKRMGMIR